MGILINSFAFAHAGWNVSTGSGVVSLDVSAEGTQIFGVRVSPDGTKAYRIDQTAGLILQYTLSTPYDITSGSYASKSLDISGQAGSIRGFDFSADGKTLVTISSSGSAATVFQYSLSTGWDLSTGSYASKSMTVTSQDNSMKGIALSNDGTKIYLCGNASGGKAFQYTLSSPNDVSTGSYASKSIDLAANVGEASPRGIFIDISGTRLYFLGSTLKTIYQFTLTGGALDTFVDTGNTLAISGNDSDMNGVTFNSDGTKMYTSGNAGNKLYQFTVGA